MPASRHPGRPRIAVVQGVAALCAACILLGAALPPPARAQAAPVPIVLLVGFPAGGSTDVLARLVAAELQRGTGRPVVVDNRPGASGGIAARALTHSPADGSHLMLAPIAVAVMAPLVFHHLDFDPATDFAPVSQLATYPFVLVVGPAHPAHDMAGLVAWARTQAGSVNFGVPGAGTLPQFLGETIGRAAGIDMVAIPYKGGAPLAADLMGGHVPAAVDVLSDVVALHRSGSVRVIAVSGTHRSPLIPEVATFAEQGHPELSASGWFAVYAPAHTPQPVLDTYARLLADAVRRAPLRDALLAMGLDPTGTTSAELAAIQRRDSERWSATVRGTGFSAD